MSKRSRAFRRRCMFLATKNPEDIDYDPRWYRRGYRKTIWMPVMTMVVSFTCHLFLIKRFERTSPLFEEKYALNKFCLGAHLYSLSVLLWSLEKNFYNPFIKRNKILGMIYHVLAMILIQWVLYTVFLYTIVSTGHKIYEHLATKCSPPKNNTVYVAILLFEPPNFYNVIGFCCFMYIAYKKKYFKALNPF